MTERDLYLLELFTERAAMREFDGNVSREHAEYGALRDVRTIEGELPKWLIDRVRDGVKDADRN